MIEGRFWTLLNLRRAGRVQLVQVVGAVVGQGMPFEPRPQILDRIHVRRVRRQECDLDVCGQAVQALPHQTTAVRLQAIPDDQQRLLQVGLERLEEFDDLLLLDTALVQPEQAVGTRQASDDRDMVPVEVKLDDRRLAFGRPSAYAGLALADAGLVYEDNQLAFSLGFF